MSNLGPFKNRQQREKHLVDFVMSLVRSSEHQTLPMRRSWAEKDQLFDGQMQWGQDEEGSEWQSRLFIHEYAPMIRESATAVTEAIFQNDKFINLIAANDEDREAARIREKLIRYYLMNSEEMAFPQKFLEFCLAGCIYGFATFKHTIGQKLVWKPELIIEEIRKQEERNRKGVNAENTRSTAILPDGQEIEGLLDEAVEELLGGGETVLSRPKLGTKKILEMCTNLSLVNPFNYFWDPDCLDMNLSAWTAERSFPKYHQVLTLMEAGVLDKRKAARMKTSSGMVPSSTAGEYSSYESQKLRQRKQFGEYSNYMPTCELLEYFGPVISPDGSEILVENAHIIIGNGKYVLKDGINGYWDQRPPYRTAIFNRRPFKADGTGVADGAVPQQRAINELFSLFVDALKLDVYSPSVVNVDRLLDPTQLNSGLHPGQVINVTGDGRAEDVFSELPQKSNIFPQLFQTVEFLKLSAQKSSSINTMSSNPASRARITGAEIQSNEGRRNLTINSLGSELDSSVIEPLVKHVDQLILQFGFTIQNLQLLAAKGVLTPGEFQYISSKSDVERYTEAMRHYKVEVRGFRYSMEREREQRSTAELMAQINQLPPQAQQKIDWSKYLPDLIERFGFEPDKWLIQNTPQDKAREENALLILDQMVMVWGQDDDSAHLPSHYDALILNGPIPSLVQHIQQHFQRLLQFGKPIPPPPPEAQQILGMGQPAIGGPVENEGQMIN